MQSDPIIRSKPAPVESVPAACGQSAGGTGALSGAELTLWLFAVSGWVAAGIMSFVVPTCYWLLVHCLAIIGLGTICRSLPAHLHTLQAPDKSTASDRRSVSVMLHHWSWALSSTILGQDPGAKKDVG